MPARRGCARFWFPESDAQATGAKLLWISSSWLLLHLSTAAAVDRWSGAQLLTAAACGSSLWLSISWSGDSSGRSKQRAAAAAAAACSLVVEVASVEIAAAAAAAATYSSSSVAAEEIAAACKNKLVAAIAFVARHHHMLAVAAITPRLYSRSKK